MAAILFDKIVTVCLNPALDVTIWIEEFDTSEPVFAKKEVVYPGGKAINVSRVLTSLGVSNTSISLVGVENEAVLAGLLADEGVNFRFVKTSGAIRENLSIVDTDNAMLKVNRMGFGGDISALAQVCHEVQQLLTDNTLLVFAGNIPPGISVEEYKSIMLSFKKRGAKLCIDSNILSKDDLVELSPFIIKPNRVEFEKIAGRSLPNDCDIAAFASELTPYIEHVVVSLGEGGIHYFSSKIDFLCPCDKVNVVSTVGAGDTALAGFIAKLYEGSPIEECVRHAVACATLSVTHEGTRLRA